MEEEGDFEENFPRFLVEGDFCEMCFLYEWIGVGGCAKHNEQRV